MISEDALFWVCIVSLIVLIILLTLFIVLLVMVSNFICYSHHEFSNVNRDIGNVNAKMYLLLGQMH